MDGHWSHLGGLLGGRRGCARVVPPVEAIQEAGGSAGGEQGALCRPTEQGGGGTGSSVSEVPGVVLVMPSGTVMESVPRGPVAMCSHHRFLLCAECCRCF